MATVKSEIGHSINQQVLVLLESCLHTCMTYTIAECTVNKLLMMDRGTVQNMQSFMTKQICEITASSWFYYKESCVLNWLLPSVRNFPSVWQQGQRKTIKAYFG